MPIPSLNRPIVNTEEKPASQSSSPVKTPVSTPQKRRIKEQNPKNLIVTHETNPSSIGKIAQTGLAIPSLAIVHKNHPVVDGFGSVTLVAHPSKINPKKHPVYDRDAFTPTFNGQAHIREEKTLNPERWESFKKETHDLADEHLKEDQDLEPVKFHKLVEEKLENTGKSDPYYWAGHVLPHGVLKKLQEKYGTTKAIDLKYHSLFDKKRIVESSYNEGWKFELTPQNEKAIVRALRAKNNNRIKLGEFHKLVENDKLMSLTTKRLGSYSDIKREGEKKLAEKESQTTFPKHLSDKYDEKSLIKLTVRALQTGKTPSQFIQSNPKIMKQVFYKEPDDSEKSELGADLDKYVKDLKDQKQTYFEAKPQKFFQLKDFAGAVVPDYLLTQELTDTLNQHGLKVLPYTDKNSRAEAIRKLAEENDLLLSEEELGLDELVKSEIVEQLEAELYFADLIKAEELPENNKCVLTIITDGNGKMLFIKRHDNHKWSVCAGHMEDVDTSPEEAARREIKEETGLTPEYLSVIKETLNPNLVCFSALCQGEPHGRNDPDAEGDPKWVNVTRGIPANIWDNLAGPEDETNVVRQLFSKEFKLQKSEFNWCEAGFLDLSKAEPTEIKPITKQPKPEKNLIVTHEFNSSKIPDIAQHGFISPSLGITHKEHPTSYFGDVALIAHPSKINPRKVPVFNQDAFTPRLSSVRFVTTPHPEEWPKFEQRVHKAVGEAIKNKQNTEEPKAYFKTVRRGLERLRYSGLEMKDFSSNLPIEIFDKVLGNNPKSGINDITKRYVQGAKGKWQFELTPQNEKAIVKALRRGGPIKGGEFPDISDPETKLSFLTIKRLGSYADIKKEAKAKIGKGGFFIEPPSSLFNNYNRKNILESAINALKQGKMPSAYIANRELKNNEGEVQSPEEKARVGAVLDKYVNDLRNKKELYFEAKPQKFMQLNDFSGAVLPRSKYNQYASLFEQHGLKTAPYDTEEDKKAQIRKLAEENDLLLSEDELDLEELQKAEFTTVHEPKESKEKNMLVVHNLTANNLEHAHELGGMVAPSIAIHHKEHPFSGFGDITLVGSPSLIDPEKAVPVFNADAYTPRHPKANYKINKKAFNSLIKELHPHSKFVGEESHLLNEFEHNLSREGAREAIEKRSMAPTLKAAYLKEKGHPIEQFQRNIPINHPVVKEKPMQDFFLQHGAPEHVYPDDTDYLKAMKNALKEAHPLYLKKITEGLNAEDKKATEEDFNNEKFFDSEGDLIPYVATKMAKDYKNLGQKEHDKDSTQEAIDDKIKDLGLQKDYKQWAINKVKAAQGTPYIPVGSKKRPYTMQNILDIMTRKVRGGEEGMVSGTGNARAMGAHQFSSLGDIKEHQGQLVSGSEMDRQQEEQSKVFDKLSDKLIRHYDGGVWQGMDAIVESLGNSFKKGGGLRAELVKHGFKNVPEALVQELKGYGRSLLNMGTPYFEAKPQRAVGIGEFKGAVVPEYVNPAALNILKQHGVNNIKTYQNEQDRLKAVNDLARENDLFLSEEDLQLEKLKK